MALLSSCWLIIESIVIQDGFLRWSYMNFYINPVFLSICQLLLWFYPLYLWLLRSFRLFYDAGLSILVMFHKLLILFVLSSGTDATQTESRQEINRVNLEVSTRVHNSVPVFYSRSFSIKAPVICKLKVLRMQEGEILEEEEEIFSECENESVLELVDQDNDVVDEEQDNVKSNYNLYAIVAGQMNSSSYDTYSSHQSSFSVCSPDLALQDSTEIKNQTRRDRKEDEIDEIYEQYCERMRWYDILNHDRTFGLSVILNQETASGPNSSEKRLKQSIERDVELVYVAQSCLSWDALRHQYIKVRDISESAGSRGAFRSDLLRDFQKFQVLLERFLEDERCEEGKRVINFAQRRSQLMSFLQVPALSGYKEEAKERKGVCAKQVLEAIEKCIQIFYEFVKLDIRKTSLWGRLGSSLFSCPLVEVEDPRDINLFVSLSNSLQKVLIQPFLVLLDVIKKEYEIGPFDLLLKKEQWLKERQGKNKKYWVKRKSRPKTMEEFGEQEVLLERFTMIDLKLVSRVLQMPLVSSSHLKWCQHKLDNIHFKDGNISTALSSSLFPSS